MQSSQRHFALCQACEVHLPWIRAACQRCGLSLTQGSMCEKCVQKPPPYHRAQALFDYAWPVDKCVVHFKDQEQHYLGKILACLMANKLDPLFSPDYVIPIPLHPTKQRQRGFNQTRELARIIAKQRGWVLEKGLCHRQDYALAQRSLSAHKRGTNISSKAFVVAPVLREKHILIIEDVITTGATITAFATALREVGVATVEVWAGCRTPKFCT